MSVLEWPRKPVWQGLGLSRAATLFFMKRELMGRVFYELCHPCHIWHVSRDGRYRFNCSNPSLLLGIKSLKILLLMDLLVQDKSYLFSDCGWDGVGERLDPWIQLHQVLNVWRLMADLHFISVSFQNYLCISRTIFQSNSYYHSIDDNATKAWYIFACL